MLWLTIFRASRGTARHSAPNWHAPGATHAAVGTAFKESRADDGSLGAHAVAFAPTANVTTLAPVAVSSFVDSAVRVSFVSSGMALCRLTQLASFVSSTMAWRAEWRDVKSASYSG